MKINGIKVSFFKDIFTPALKNMFNFRSVWLERQPAVDTVEVNLFKNTSGIKSETFRKLLTPEFTVKNNVAKNGMRITTLIDKKNSKTRRSVCCSSRSRRAKL